MTVLWWLLVASAAADTITNASWTFSTNTTSQPTQPIGPGLSAYSTDDYLGWTLINARATVSYVSDPAGGSALEFSYNGNHAEYLNGTTLTLTSTVSELPAGYSLADIQLSYNTRWNMTGQSVTETWAFSLDGGAFVNFYTNAAVGSVWQTAGSVLNGITLTNGNTIAFRATISGATGNNGNLDFDNIRITSTIVPEPSTTALATIGGLAALTAIRRKSS